MVQDFIDKNFFRLLLFTLVFGVVLYDTIGFDYTDELCALALFVLFIFWMFRTPDWRLNKAFLVTICIFVFYLCYSFVIGSNSKKAILADFLIQIKPYLAFFCVYSMAPSFSQKQKEMLKKISSALWFFLLPIGVLGLINIRYLMSVMGVPAYFAAAVIAVSLIYLFCGNFEQRDKYIFFIFLSLGIVSGRSKFYGFYVLSIAMITYFSYTRQLKLNLKTILVLLFTTCIMLIAAKSKIELYFIQSMVGDAGENEIARYVLYITSFDIFRDYFPFGSGFASFGTFYSGKYYSDIYEKYAIDGVWGMTKNEYGFIADTYYPSLAQFGVVGVLLYVFFWFYIFRKSYMFFKQENNIKEFVLSILIICYFVVEGVADSTFTTHRGLFMMMLLGLILSTMKAKQKKIESNENIAN